MKHKYFDYYKQREIDLDSDGCKLETWNTSYNDHTHAIHDKGFLIFLPPEEIKDCDEYSESDPYSVEERIDNAFHRRRIECTLDLLDEALKGKKQSVINILDIGCGEGHITTLIKDKFPEAEISALDYSISAIAYAVDHFKDCDFIVGDAYKLPYRIDYFDVVVCNNLWEHVPGPLDLLISITKVLKPSGHVIISTPSRYRLGNLARVLIGKQVNLISKHHVTEYTVGQVHEQLNFGGYVVEKAYSKKDDRSGLLSSVARIFFTLAIKLTGSHHILESTVFYLAINKENKFR